jgi:stearoyl-CoA desaturase (delta-9 desaturase)
MSSNASTFESSHPDSRVARYLMLAVVIGPFLATIYAVWRLWAIAVYWPDLVLFFGMYVLAGLGITIGYHRMLTHSGFESKPWVRAVFLAMGGIAVESGPLRWASTHLKHHAHSDKEGDPHSPLDGFVHAHLGWIIDGWDIEPEKHGAWMLKDPMVLFFERTFVYWVAIGLLIPFTLGGLWAMFTGASFISGALTGLLWGGFVRIFITHHVTWSVNSICHVFGSRMFDTKDQSRNNFIVGLLAFGEGWHNNHHAFPNSAEHGMAWWQIDTSAYVIRLLEKLGLVWNVKRVTPEQLARKIG